MRLRPIVGLVMGAARNSQRAQSGNSAFSLCSLDRPGVSARRVARTVLVDQDLAVADQVGNGRAAGGGGPLGLLEGELAFPGCDQQADALVAGGRGKGIVVADIGKQSEAGVVLVLLAEQLGGDHPALAAVGCQPGRQPREAGRDRRQVLGVHVERQPDQQLGDAGRGVADPARQRPACLDEGAGGDQGSVVALEQGQRFLAVAAGGQGGGGGDAQPLGARTVRPDRLEEARGRLRAPRRDQQQRAMLGGIGGGGAVPFLCRQEGERVALARAESEPGAQYRHREGEQLLALDRVDLQPGGTPVAVAERLGDEQEACVGQQGVCALERVRGAQRQRPVAGGDGMVHRLGGDHLVLGIGRERGGIAGAGLLERPGRGGDAGLDIGVERRARLGARLRPLRRKTASDAGEQKLTCWDNSVLLRLRGRPS